MEHHMNMKKCRKLCIKAVSGNITAEEKEVLDNWLAVSDENKKEFETISNMWNKSMFFESAEMPDVNIEWNELFNRVISEKSRRGRKNSVWSELLSGIRLVAPVKLKSALSVVAVVFILITVLLMTNKEAYSPDLKMIATSNKEQKKIELPDGSKVLLNRNSEIRFAKIFTGDIREVKLNGEAFFSVTKNKHPFIVLTKNARTTVLGTKFDVWSRGDETRVIVKEGKVNLAPKQKNAAAVVLLRGQLSAVINDEKPLPPKQVDCNYLLGWMDGRLVFNKTPLADIVSELEGYYNVSITLNGNDLKKCTVTGSFKNDDIDSVLTMICLTLDIGFEKQQNGYLIRLKNTDR